MHKYYNHDTYVEVFGKKQNEPVKVYNSIEELEAQTDRYDYHLASQLRHFKKLKEDFAAQATEIIDQINNL